MSSLARNKTWYCQTSGELRHSWWPILGEDLRNKEESTASTPSAQHSVILAAFCTSKIDDSRGQPSWPLLTLVLLILMFKIFMMNFKIGPPYCSIFFVLRILLWYAFSLSLLGSLIRSFLVQVILQWWAC